MEVKGLFVPIWKNLVIVLTARRNGTLKGHHHVITSIVLYILLYVLYQVTSEISIDPKQALKMAIFSIAFGALFPDWDLIAGSKFHRNWLTHSNFIHFVLVAIFHDDVYFWFLLAINSLHLLFDIRLKKEKRRGFYCVRLPSGRMNGEKTTEWLATHGGIGMIASVLVISMYF